MPHLTGLNVMAGKQHRSVFTVVCFDLQSKQSDQCPALNATLSFPYVNTRTIAQASFYGAFQDPERSNSLSHGHVFFF